MFKTKKGVVFLKKSSNLEQLSPYYSALNSKIIHGDLRIQDVVVGLKGILDGTYPVKQVSPVWYDYDKNHPKKPWNKSLKRQAARIRQLNLLRNWNLSDFSIPYDIVESFVPKTDTEVLILVPYLPSKDNNGCLLRTIREFWQIIDPPEGYKKDYGKHLSESSFENIKSIYDSNFPSCVKLVAIDLNSHVDVGKLPSFSQNGQYLAGFEVLMSAIYFPKWLESIKDGKINPQPKMAGLYINYAEKDIEKTVPLTIGYNGKNQRLILGTELPKSCKHYSIVTIRELAVCNKM